MSAPLELAGKLLARTASSFLEEARTSALMLCQLIRREGLKIVDPKQVPPPKAEPRSRPFWDRSEYRRIRARFDGHCGRCKEPHYEGDEIAWRKGYGVLCVACWEER